MKITLHICKCMNDFCLICDKSGKVLCIIASNPHEIKALKKEVNYPEIY